jgi:hypothetical protein
MKHLLSFLLLAGVAFAQQWQLGTHTTPPSSGSSGWTLVQHVPVTGAACGTGSTSCTATVAPTGSGHLLVILGTIYNTSQSVSFVTSAACGVSWAYPAGAHYYNGAQGAGTNGAYCLSSASGVTSITVTLSGTPGSGLQTFDFIEYAWSGSTISLDGAPASGNVIESSTPSGIAQTLSGSNDVIVQWIRTDRSTSSDVTSISGSYSNPFDTPTADATGYAGSINTSNGAAPTWTLDISVQTQVASMAFSGT